MKLRASAMTYSLVVALLVTLLLGSLVLLHGYTRSSMDVLYYQELAQDNLESGRNLVLYGEGGVFGEWAESLHSEEDSFSIRSRAWGLYGLMWAEGVHGAWRTQEATLFGMAPMDEFAAALFLKDRNRPLTLAGDAKLSGPLYVPKAGIKRGYVGRDGFKGKDLYTGARYSSEGHTATADYAELRETRELLVAVAEGRFGDAPLPDSMSCSWQGDPLEVRSSRPLVLDQSVRGQVIVMAPEIIVAAGAQVEDALLFARSIVVEKGFRGRLQAFATDSLVVQEEVTLSYPSTLCVADPDGKGSLAIQKGSRVEGMVVNDAALVGADDNARSYTLIEPEVEVAGTVYVTHNLDLKGRVIGTVVTDNFLLRTPSAVYENHLYDCQLGREDLHPRYAMGLLQAQAEDYLIIRRLR